MNNGINMGDTINTHTSPTSLAGTQGQGVTGSSGGQYSQSYYDYIQRIKQYRYPVCTKGQVHDYLNMICIDERCDNSVQLEGLCSMCIDNNFHRRAYHSHKNLKKFLRDLVQLSELQEKTFLEATIGTGGFDEDPIEKRFKNLAGEFRAKGNQCLDISKKITEQLDAYKIRRAAQSSERVGLRHIVEEILNNENEKSLQAALAQLHSFVYIEQDMLKLNAKTSQTQRIEVERNAQAYVAGLQDALDRMDKIRLDAFARGSFNSGQPNSYNNNSIGNGSGEPWQSANTIQQNGIVADHIDSKHLTREIWAGELKVLAMKIETIQRAAVDEANRKGNHNTASYWRDWEEFASNDRNGWPVDGKHSSNQGHVFCYKCFQIYQDALRSIDPLKKEYVHIEQRILQLGIYA